ncbi:hypothetical protein [Streptomyces uncialis]|uniref:hypothetical protein n=1 Tax=Streptomyces uncialis TaxID=1048205 RepID=UPI002257BF57|nr:hypothetical protein [Streptomyces uncialis]MCX4658254.1 hypothetical protein [Streptomyces uncialis]
MIFRRARFTTAVAGFEAAVRGRDPRTSQEAFAALHQHFERAGESEFADAAPRLAALLAELPPGPRAVTAQLIGACVERGADPLVCAPALLAGLARTLEAAAEFPARWRAAGGGELPQPDAGEPHSGVVARVGEDVARGWWNLPLWETAALAVLNHRAVRGLVPDRPGLLATAGRIADAADGHLQCLIHALLVLDDEPLVVLHRDTRTGYRMRMTGIADNFQLHTLLAAELAGAGHVPGEIPAPEAVAVCRDAPGQVPTTGTFQLTAPDGGAIWNEGTPSDIPVVDGVRLLVLDPPPYARGWPTGRFLAGMPGDLRLERVLDAAETGRWFGSVADEARR